MSTVSFSLFVSPYFLDWTTEDYSSHLEASWQMDQENMFWIESPYIWIYLVDGTDTGIRENSLITQVAWDWSAADGD